MTDSTGIVGLIITNIHELLGMYIYMYSISTCIYQGRAGGLAGAGRRAPQSNQISSSLRDINISHFYGLERGCPGKAEAGRGEETYTQRCTDQTGIVWRIIIYTVPTAILIRSSKIDASQGRG